MKLRLRLLAIAVTLGLLLMPATALAQLVMPILYQGGVTIDGVAAPMGTMVTAEIDEVEVATNAPGGTTEVGRYTLNILADEGDVVVLKVEGVVGGETTYPDRWAIPIVNLDLSVGEISLMPVATFSASPLSGNAPLTVEFTDESLNMSDNASWDWDFGDGGSSTEASPTHEFFDEGSYTVTLTVTTDEGTDSEVKADYIVVIAEGASDPYIYDTDGDGEFSYDETLAAVVDYEAGTIGESDALAVVKLYFS